MSPVLPPKKIFFGHQSVGNNIVQGIRDLMIADSRLKMNIVKSEDPQLIPSPAFVESEIGENGNPGAEINTLKAKYPSLKIVQIAVPLTTASELTPRAWIKSILGRTTMQDSNVPQEERQFITSNFLYLLRVTGGN